jgi:hypothetical protein
LGWRNLGEEDMRRREEEKRRRGEEEKRASRAPNGFTGLIPYPRPNRTWPIAQ